MEYAGIAQRDTDIAIFQCQREANRIVGGHLPMLNDIGDQFLDDDRKPHFEIGIASGHGNKVRQRRQCADNRALRRIEGRMTQDVRPIASHRGSAYPSRERPGRDFMRVRFILTAIAAAGIPFLAQAEIGRIKLASGPATVQRNGVAQPAKPGLVLLKGDTLITGPNGRIGVTFVDNTRFAAGPNSRIALNEFDFNTTTHDGKFVTQVDRGSLAIFSGQIAKKNHDAMRVRTPTSLLGVRGTRFVVEVN